MTTRTQSRNRRPGRPAGRGGPSRRTRRTPLVWLVLGGVVLLAAVLAFVLDGGGGAQTAPMEVDGAGLPTFAQGAADPALGQPAPALRGTTTDGQGLAVEPGDGPTVLLFLAHWCPVCQAEVPKVQEWLDGGGMPEGVEFVAVATATDANRPNHPPADWLAGEGWSVPTLLDDAASSAANAYGLPAFPYWVFLDADGTVVARQAGVLEVDVLETAMRSLADLEG